MAFPEVLPVRVSTSKDGIALGWLRIDVIKEKAVYCLPVGVLYQAFHCTATIDDLNDDKVGRLCMYNSDLSQEFRDVRGLCLKLREF